MRALVMGGAFLAVTFAATSARSQCTKDTDCKGERICIDGRCTAAVGQQANPMALPAAPLPSTQPAAPASPYPEQPAATFQQLAPAYQQPITEIRHLSFPNWYEHFYVHVAGNLGPHGWGTLNIDRKDVSIVGKVRGGVHVSGYGVLSSHFHIGGYFDYGRGDARIDEDTVSADQYGFGLTLKTGLRVSERVWLGLDGSVGMNLIDPSGSSSWKGFEVSPRIHMDLLAADLNGFRMGGFVAFGPTIVPYGRAKIDDKGGTAHLIYLNLLLGLTFGT